MEILTFDADILCGEQLACHPERVRRNNEVIKAMCASFDYLDDTCSKPAFPIERIVSGSYD